MEKRSFLSRVGLIENLRSHLLAGQSAAMIGGPMIGKSTLTQNLSHQIYDREFRAVVVPLKHLERPDDFWGLLLDSVLRQAIGPEKKSPFKKRASSLPDLMSQLHHIYEKTEEAVPRKIILLLDDCDRLVTTELVPQIVNLVMESVNPSIHAVCWTGGAAWGAWIRSHANEFKSALRFYPLSVVPIREAKLLISNQLNLNGSRDEVDRIWSETGGHPLLLMNAFDPGGEDRVGTLSERLYSELHPEEKRLLNRLGRLGKWILLSDLTTPGGLPVSKEMLDRLCMLGLTVRTLIDGVAAIRLTSPLLIKAD